MGILNVTPDSFSGDGVEAPAALRHAEALVAAGCDVLDIGGESTRPGAKSISAEEEMRRVIRPLLHVIDVFPVPVSIDTRKAAVAEAALAAGAKILNDTSGLADPTLAEIAGRHEAWLVVMHPHAVRRARSPIEEVGVWLEAAIRRAVAAGCRRDRIIVDPGLGFKKGPRTNLEILRDLGNLRALGAPILVGPSRKETIARVLDGTPADRVEGSIAMAVAAVAHGAQMVRVHDVARVRQAVRMTDELVRRR